MRDFWYDALIMREGVMVSRSGVVIAANGLDALDEVNRRAKEVWEKQVVSCKIREMDEHGELIGEEVTRYTESHTCEKDALDNVKQWATPYRVPTFGIFRIGD